MATAPTRKKTNPKDTRTKPKVVPVSAVVRFIRALEERGLTEKFVAAADRSKASIGLRGKSVEFVSKYLKKLSRSVPPKVAKTRASRKTAAARQEPIDPCPKGFDC
jgi:hypothetical protein